MQTFKDAFKHPIIIIFFALLLLVTAADFAVPDKAESELENRRLTQSPEFTWSAFIGNEWTLEYGDYIRDQFVGRDDWVSAWSVLEAAQGKLENGGVWFADDGYQIAKNSATPGMALFETNVESVCQLAARQPGRVTVMVVPSPANILSDKLRWSPPQADEDALTDGMFAQMRAAGAEVLDLREAFRAAEAAGEPLYYRTDHHWLTTGGALLAYHAYAGARGRNALLPDASLLREVPDFLGTNFAKTKRLGTRPDTLSYYDLPNAMQINTLNDDGSVSTETTGLMDKPKLDAYDKYGAFLHGNNGYSVIEGDGKGSVLVLKDSYGNCFVPYLTQMYAKVGVIDLRAWHVIDELVERDGYGELLVLYSFASFAEDSYIIKMTDGRQESVSLPE